MEGFYQGQCEVLERIAGGAPLPETLDAIVCLIERTGGMGCSLLMLDADGVHVRLGAASGLPPDYVQALDGLPIGPVAGSCGAAMYHRRRVIVEDIATHPNWADYRAIALPYGLRACWSTPVVDADGGVLGTFAMYYRAPRGPTAREVELVDAAAHLAAIAIVRDRAERALREREAYAVAVAGELGERVKELTLFHQLARVLDRGELDGEVLDEVVALIPAAMRAPAECAARVRCAGLVAQTANWRDGEAGFAAECDEGAVEVAHVLPVEGGFLAEERELVRSAAEMLSSHARKVAAEVALRRSEERLRAVIENTPDVAIQWYDEAGRIIFCNAASLSLFGWRGREVLGKRLIDLGFFDEEEEARFAEARALAAGGEPPPPFEFAFRRPDGARGCLLSTVFRIPHQTESCYVCMDVDLTERRRMEEAVRAGEALRATIYASVVDPIFCLSVEAGDRYRFLSVNPAFLRATGLTAGAVVGHDVADVIPEPSLARALAGYREAVEARREVRWEEVTTYASVARHGEVTVCPIFDGGGRCTLVGTVHDITRLREAETERRAFEAQLQQSHRLQSLGTLASGVAHDFNNVLAAIAANAEIALDPGLGAAEARERLRDIQQATRRATGLVRQILAFGRKQEARKERADLRRVLDEALGLLRATIPSRVQISTRLWHEALETLIDPTQLHQIVMNLVTNAAQAIKGEGSIEVVAAPHDHVAGAPLDLAEGRYVRVTVRDTGHGMDEPTLARAFDPFFTTKPAGEGTGLGLSIVHGIVRGHGGAVAVSSRLGEGTTFELYFPMLGPEVAAAAAVEEAAAHGERVMLVDDEEAIVFLGSRILTKLGYQVSGHANPNRALEEFRAAPERFDAVISDVAMPGMSGVALLGEIRRLRPETVVILTSGYVRPEDVDAARACGLGEPIPKPHTVEEFAWAVSRRLAGRASHHP